MPNRLTGNTYHNDFNVQITITNVLIEDRITYVSST